MKYSYTFSLPPSINSSLVRANWGNRFIHTKEARNWIDFAFIDLKTYCMINPMIPINDFFYLDMKFFLKDKRSDSHNYKKLLFDVMQKCGICTNDKFIMDRTQSVDYDKLNPRIEIEFEIKDKINA